MAHRLRRAAQRLDPCAYGEWDHRAGQLVVKMPVKGSVMPVARIDVHPGAVITAGGIEHFRRPLH